MIPNTINDVLYSLNAINGDFIKDQQSYAQFFSVQWIGSLTSLNNESMYKIYVQNAQSMIITGPLRVPSGSTIDCQIGWNWIGYIPHVSMGINQALSNRVNQTGDFIKNQNEYAFYVNEEIGWLGSLRFMNPGDGFMLQAQSNSDFTYPDYSIRHVDDYPEFTPITLKQSPAWTVNPQEYEYTASLTMELTNEGTSLQNGNCLVGAFAGEECRGTATSIEVDERYLYFLTIYSNIQNEEIGFKVYSEYQDEIIYSDSVFIFENDLILGTPASPYLLELEIGDILLAPQNVIISRSIDTVELSWEPVDGANSYIVYSSDSPNGVFYEEPNGYVQETTWINFVQGSKRFYKVKATDERLNRIKK
jgi:hypothetical protein